MDLNKLPDVIICHFCQLIVTSVIPVNDELFHLFEACKQPLQYGHKVCYNCIRRCKRKLDKDKLNDRSENNTASSGSESSQQSQLAVGPPPVKQRPGPLSSKRHGPLSSKRPGPLSSKRPGPLSSKRPGPLSSKRPCPLSSKRMSPMSDRDTNLSYYDSSSSSSLSINESTYSNVSNTSAPAPRKRSKNKGGQPSFSEEDVNDPSNMVNQQLSMRPRSRSSSIHSSESISTAAPHRVYHVCVILLVLDRARINQRWN